MQQEFKKMVLIMDAGQAGTDTAEFLLVPVDMTQDELEEYAWEAAKGWAEVFGIYPEAEMPDDYDEDEASWSSDEYNNNIGGHFEDYDPEKHDGLRVNNDNSWREI